MKLVSIVVGFAIALAALGFACGPEQTYCYDQHKTCVQAKLDQDKEAADRAAAEAAAKADAQGGTSDGGATVVD